MRGIAIRSLAVAAQIVTAIGCQSQASSAARGKRIIVLGIDGMDPGFVERHWDSLPNLKRLAAEGEYKRLATTMPPQSPVAWSSFITGMDPGGHGIYDFIHRNPETMMPFSSMAETAESGRTLTIGPYVLPLSAGQVKSYRKGKAFWQILSEYGVPVDILRMPTNFPPVETETGHSLAGMGTPDMSGTFGTFAFYTDDPEEKQRTVPGGKIFPVKLENGRTVLRVEGPVNTLRKERPVAAIPMTVDVGTGEAVARFRVGESSFILKEGEWSRWIKAEFPLIPFMGASGMFRVYAKKLRPEFQIYVSPINIDPEHTELPITSPPSYSAELAKAIGPFYTQGMAEDTGALRQKVFTLDEYLRQARMVSEEHLKVLRYALERFRDGLLFFHFFGVDQNSHMLWADHEDKLLETYKLVDETVGWVVEKAKGATVMVMSDHGFTTFDRSVHLNTWLMKEGFLTLTDPSKTGNEELFVNVDWSQTQAYSVGLNGLYINMQGRETNGTVAPGSEAEVLMRKLRERLLALKDPETGQPVVESLVTAREAYQGSMENAPDLLVGYYPGYRSSWQTALGAIPAKLVENNTEDWRGDHCIASKFVPGVLISNRKSKVADPRLVDLPVTILQEFGAPAAAGMVGRNIY